MRIIAGSLKGRYVYEPHGHRTHPMSEKMRGAIFNALGDIHGLTVLDAYAGSGAIGLEAVSRGVQHVQSIDSDVEAFNTIEKNIRELRLQTQIAASRANCMTWLGNNTSKVYDIIIADPPYDNVITKHLDILAVHVRNGGVLVLSLPADISYEHDTNTIELLKKKTYGTATLSFYRRLP